MAARRLRWLCRQVLGSPTSCSKRSLAISKDPFSACVQHGDNNYTLAPLEIFEFLASSRNQTQTQWLAEIIQRLLNFPTMERWICRSDSYYTRLVHLVHLLIAFYCVTLTLHSLLCPGPVAPLQNGPVASPFAMLRPGTAKCSAVPRLPSARFISASEAVPFRTLPILERWRWQLVALRDLMRI